MSEKQSRPSKRPEVEIREVDIPYELINLDDLRAIRARLAYVRFYENTPHVDVPVQKPEGNPVIYRFAIEYGAAGAVMRVFSVVEVYTGTDWSAPA